MLPTCCWLWRRRQISIDTWHWRPGCGKAAAAALWRRRPIWNKRRLLSAGLTDTQPFHRLCNTRSGQWQLCNVYTPVNTSQSFCVHSFCLTSHFWALLHTGPELNPRSFPERLCHSAIKVPFVNKWRKEIKGHRANSDSLRKRELKWSWWCVTLLLLNIY